MRTTLNTIIVALLVSGTAYYTGTRLEYQAHLDICAAAYVPPRWVEGPKEPPPGAKLPVVTDLDDNPFGGNDSDGVPIPKDPVMRARGERGRRYQQYEQVANTVAAAVPVLALVFLMLRAMHRRRMTETATDQPEEPCDSQPSSPC